MMNSQRLCPPGDPSRSPYMSTVGIAKKTGVAGLTAPAAR